MHQEALEVMDEFGGCHEIGGEAKSAVCVLHRTGVCSSAASTGIIT